MNCFAFDPFVTKEAMAAIGVEKVEMKGLLTRSDYISLHSPLTKETENAFGIEAIPGDEKNGLDHQHVQGPGHPGRGSDQGPG